jgi:hypothetical protein
MTDWNTQKAAAERAAAEKWGMWRKYIAANPLTGFWSGVALGASPMVIYLALAFKII